MSDDLTVRLSEAAKHYAAQSYDASAKAVAAAAAASDSNDPKIRHNAAIVDFSKLGFSSALSTINTLRSLVASAPAAAAQQQQQPAAAASAAAATSRGAAASSSSVNAESASWSFSGQDALHFNEALLRAHMGDIDTAYGALAQLLAAKAPVALRTRIRAGAVAFVLRRSILARGAAPSASAAAAAGGGGGGGLATRNVPQQGQAAGASGGAAAVDVTEKTLSELVTSPAFMELSAAEQRELNGIVAAATATDLPSLQAWLKEYGSAAGSKGGAAAASPAEVAIALNNAGVQALYGGDAATAAQFLAQAESAVTAAAKDVCPAQAGAVRFNLGLALFAAGSSSAAAAVLAGIQRVMSDNATFWCRFGQVIAALATEQATAAAQQRLGALFRSRAAALHLQGERPPEAGIISPLHTEALLQDNGGGSATAAQLFELADAALQNAYVLVVGSLASAAAGSGGGGKGGDAGGSGTDLGALVAAAPAGQQELIQTLYAQMTYVALNRGNMPAAAKLVLDYFSVRCAAWSGNRDATAVMLCYAVEALCSVQRAGAALKLLQSHDLGELILPNSEPSPAAAAASAAAGGAGYNSAGANAAGLLDQATTDAMLVNVCVAQIMNGNWQKALSIGATVLPRLQQRSANAVLLAAYLELARGNRDKALELFEKSPIREPV